MSIEDDLARVKEQENVLVFQRFDEEEAFALGSRLRDLGRRRSLPIIVDVSLWDRPLFYTALPGSAASNRDWARRKINSVRHYQKSTYRLFLEQGARERILAPDHGLDPRDYAIAGGAFPIRVGSVGVIGAVAVSGLPQRDDHNLAVEALAGHLGVDAGAVALGPDHG